MNWCNILSGRRIQTPRALSSLLRLKGQVVDVSETRGHPGPLILYMCRELAGEKFRFIGWQQPPGVRWWTRHAPMVLRLLCFSLSLVFVVPTIRLSYGGKHCYAMDHQQSPVAMSLHLGGVHIKVAGLLISTWVAETIVETYRTYGRFLPTSG